MPSLRSRPPAGRAGAAPSVSSGEIIIIPEPPEPPGVTPVTATAPQPPAATPGGPKRWAICVVLMTMGLTVALFLAGYPLGAVIGVLAGGAYLGLEIVERIDRLGRPGRLKADKGSCPDLLEQATRIKDRC